MALADLLIELFPKDPAWTILHGVLSGVGSMPDGAKIHVLGVVEATDLGVDGALQLARRVLEIARMRDDSPILLLLDSGGQRMSQRDELLGLNEYLAHLAKALMAADRTGHRTVGLLYGTGAAGAFIVTALATQLLVALPNAHPKVMDLPAMARVTKLSVEMLEQKARSTAVFAPGVANMIKLGAIAEQWDAGEPLAARLAAVLSTPFKSIDSRDRIGETRGGRSKAAAIAARVAELAGSDG